MGGGSSKKTNPNEGAGAGNAGMSGGPYDDEEEGMGPEQMALMKDAKMALSDPALTQKYSCPDTSSPLGCGAYASVWRVIDKNDGSEWALKIIDKSHGNCTEEQMKLVRWESKALKLCEHPNVTHLRETFETSSGGSENQGFYFLVMEVMNGGELFDRIESRRHYSEADAREAVKTLCTTLLHCHNSGVVHLDIKPENILLAGKEGTPKGDIMKLCDFGISRSIKEGDAGVVDGMIQPDGHMHGTPAYLAPEMIRMAPFGPKCDVWAMGCMTYILLGGLPPFDEPMDVGPQEGQTAMFRDILRGNFYPFDEFDPSPEVPKNPWDFVSGEAKDFVKTLLTVDPSERPDFNGVLQHPWMHSDKVSSEHLGASQVALKKFNARKRLQGAINKVRGAIRIAKLSSFIGDLKSAAQTDGASVQ